jgi:hypothetical protein
VTRRTLIVLLALGATLAVPIASRAEPFQQDPMGPISDVTADWQHYQPAAAFCVKPDVAEYASGGIGKTVTGRLAACRRSGFAASAKGLVLVHVRTPTLCPGCRRLFIDFSKIPKNAPPSAYAHGHVFYRLNSFNWTYTVDPLAHSPNTKTFTNDKLLVPNGSPQEPFVRGFDMYAMDYVSDTAHFVHSASQGPYYAGPWYVNRSGQRIDGVYLDVDVADATEYPDPNFNAIGYAAGFNSGQACPSDADGYYGGCFDWWGMSASTVDPYEPS